MMLLKVMIQCEIPQGLVVRIPAFHPGGLGSTFGVGRKNILGFPGGTSGKEPACQCRRHKRHWLDPWVGKIP